MGYRKYKKITLFVVSFFILWTAAWLIHNLLATTIWPSLSDSHNQALIYWAIMKVLVWIVFPVIYVRKVIKPENNKSFLGLNNVKKAVMFGLTASLIWVIGSFSFEYLQGQQSFHFIASFTFLWVITGTPISEEFTFRGVILPGLQKAGIGFWPANIITSVVFILIHCLGWAFQGAIMANLTSVVAGSILLLSLATGWLRHKSNSLYSGAILHSINNLYSSLM